ncbi:MAG TPA: hypothetical protein VHT24_15820, partial [Pseudacidobacterium sp.]|nr:hypothetical protein [Pseudacidobacterium sp.]
MFLVGLSYACGLYAQQDDTCSPRNPKRCIVNIAQDQVGIITSPLRTSAGDLLWIVPFGVATGFTIDYDAHIMRDIGINPSREDKFKKFSDYTTYGATAAPVIGYLVGAKTHNDYL